MNGTMNLVSLVGNVVRDFELRKANNGDLVVNLDVIIDNPFSQEKKTYVNLTAWDRVAEAMAEKLYKGSKVFIHGRLTTDQYTDKATGQVSNKLIVTVSNFFDLTKPKE